MVDAINDYLGLPLSGMPGLHPPSGDHAGDDHHQPAPAGAVASSAAPAPTATQEV
jgi:hypothetical protein